MVDDYDEGCGILGMTADDRATLAGHSLEHLGGLLSVLWQFDDLVTATAVEVRDSGQGE